jgi:hypothetical protein
MSDLIILQTFTHENSFGLDSSGARQTIKSVPDEFQLSINGLK